MTRRPLALVLAAFALAGPASPARAAVPVAGAVTVVEATTTAKTVLYVPTRTPLRITVEGTGRMVGVILRERYAQPEETGFLRAAGGTYAWGSDVRKGSYTVYVLTDGAPVRVTLRMSKLSGSTSLTAATPVRSGISALQTSVGAPVSWSAGTDLTPNGAADLFMVATWQQDESAYAQANGCFYDGTEGVEALGAYRWLPGCPMGSMVGFSEVKNPTAPPGPIARAGGHAMVLRTSSSGAGTYGLGLWVTAQNVRPAQSFAVWLGR